MSTTVKLQNLHTLRLAAEDQFRNEILPAEQADVQVRRLYGAFALVFLLAGLILAAVPTGTQPAGSLFLPYGYICLGLALPFLLTFAHNETELQNRHVGADSGEPDQAE